MRLIRCARSGRPRSAWKSRASFAAVSIESPPPLVRKTFEPRCGASPRAGRRARARARSRSRRRSWKASSVASWRCTASRDLGAAVSGVRVPEARRAVEIAAAGLVPDPYALAARDHDLAARRRRPCRRTGARASSRRQHAGSELPAGARRRARRRPRRGAPRPPRAGARSGSRGAETLSAAITRPAASRIGAAAATSPGSNSSRTIAKPSRARCGRSPRAAPASPSAASSSSVEVADEHAAGRGGRERRQPADAAGGMQRRARRLGEQRQHLRALPDGEVRALAELGHEAPQDGRARRRAGEPRRRSSRARRRASRAGRRASRGRARRSPARRASRACARAGSCRRRPSRSGATTPRPSRAASGAESATSTSRPRASPTVPGFTPAPPRADRRARRRGARRTRPAPPRSRRRAGPLVASRAAPRRGARREPRGRAARRASSGRCCPSSRPSGRQKHSRKRSSVCCAPKKWPPWPTSTCASSARLASSTSSGVNCVQQQVEQLDVGDELRVRGDEAALEPAGRLPDDVRAGEEGRLQRVHRLVAGLVVDQPGSRSACRRRRARAARCGGRSGRRRAARSPTRGRRRSGEPVFMSVVERNEPITTACPAG